MEHKPVEEMPIVGSCVELTLGDGSRYRVIIDSSRKDGLVVAAPRGVEYPELLAEDLLSRNMALTIGWLADRAWYAVTGGPLRLLAGTSTPRWLAHITGEPQQTNRRRFMRGGGGEPIKIGDVTPTGQDVLVNGRVVDLSEGSVRCKVPELGREPGETTSIVISVDGQAIETVGIVHALREPRERPGVDAVLTYGLPEMSARFIRQYLFKRQLEARRAKRGVHDDDV